MYFEPTIRVCMRAGAIICPLKTNIKKNEKPNGATVIITEAKTQTIKKN